MFTGLINQTELLEALDWDEEKLEQLSEFIDSQSLIFTPTPPAIFLSQVEEHFGEPARKVLERIFIDEVEKIKKRENNYEN